MTGMIKIYKAGFKNDIANSICDKYARASFDFLTNIYKQYNYETIEKKDMNISLT